MPKMRERQRGNRPNTAMKWLVDFLNLDFNSVAGEKDVDRFLASTSFPPDSLQNAKRLQGRLMHHLAPVLISDPDQVGEQRRAVLQGIIRVSKQTGRPTGEIDNLNRLVQRLRHLNGAQLEQEREKGLRLLGQLLTEWAKSTAVRPQWQLDPVDARRAALVPRSKTYRIGRKRFVISRWDLHQGGIWNTGLMIVASCLESGQLNRLRNCVYCSRFFFANDFRKTFCSSECQKAHDRKAARKRMARWRKEQEKQTKTYALGILPKLSPQLLRMPELQTKLRDSELDVLDSMRCDVEVGVPKEKVWARASSRRRALFRKLQLAGVK